MTDHDKAAPPVTKASPNALHELPNEHERFEKACHAQVAVRDAIERIIEKFELTSAELVVILAEEMHAISLRCVECERE